MSRSQNVPRAGFALVGLALAVTLGATAVQARHVVRTRDHTYYVDVRNESHRSVWDARVTVMESGDRSAYVNVRANGYRDARQWVSISPDRNTVYVSVRIQDPTVRVTVVDGMGQRVVGAWVDQNQFSSPADEYRLEIRMPAEGFDEFQASDVRVDYVFGEYVYVRGSAGNRRVEIRIPRRRMGAGMYINLRVNIPSDADLEEKAREEIRAANFEALHAHTL